MKLLLSVRHTGTRFVKSFLDYLGCEHIQAHSQKGEEHKIVPHLDAGILVPMRDPLLVWMSWYTETKQQNPDYMTETLLDSWDMLTHYLDGRKRFIFRLDTEDKADTLLRAAKFCHNDRPLNRFIWEPVGVTSTNPNDYLNWYEMAIEKPALAQRVLEKLAPYRKMWGYNLPSERAA